MKFCCSTTAWPQRDEQSVSKVGAGSLQSHCGSAVNWQRNCAQAFGPRLMGAAVRRPWIRCKSETETLQLRFHLANRQGGLSIAILNVSPVARRTPGQAARQRLGGGRMDAQLTRPMQVPSFRYAAPRPIRREVRRQPNCKPTIGPSSDLTLNSRRPRQFVRTHLLLSEDTECAVT
jgi:hypothetical protein